MSAIGKGDLVEAVRDAAGDLGAVFHKGDVMLVTGLLDVDGLGLVCGDCGETATVLVCVSLLPPGYGSCPCCFKPISGGQPGMFADLLKVSPTAPLEPVAA